MIKRETIDRIFDTADIVDVISDFVQLKRRGTNYVGLCPFHNEKTPSFNVSPSKGIYKCFGCGNGGNVVQFVMEHEHMSYPEAMKYLANKYNIPVEEEKTSDEDIEKRDMRESMMVVNEFARKYFIRQLIEDERGRAVGLAYFRERGFTDQMIEKFDLGYCPEGKDTFTEDALGKGYKLEFLEKTGLTIVRDEWRADRFSGRVMFPIHSLSGRVMGFGGRALKTNDKKTAKYLNSPESEVYHKSKILYGIYQAKRAIVQQQVCFLVEGYTDVISMHQKGIENVVASSGTSLTEDQIQLIHRFSENITILYDGDPAGLKASLRGIDMILEQGMNVKLVMFPEGEDPDSFARNNSPDDIHEYIETHQKDFIRFKAGLLLDEAQDDPLKRSEMISSIVRSISVLDNTIKQMEYVKSVSKTMDVDEDILHGELRKYRYKHLKEKQKQQKRKQLHERHAPTPAVPSNVTNIIFEEHEKEIIRILLAFGNTLFSKDPESGVERTVAEYIINEIRNDELKFENLLYNKLFEEVADLLSNGKKVSHQYFTQHTDSDIAHISVELVQPKYHLHEFWKKRGTYVHTAEDNLQEYIPNLIHQYKRKVMQKAQDKTVKRIKALQNKDADNKEIYSLLEEKRNIEKVISLLVKNKGIVIMR
ncbi:MAG: DNA primase [Bacteroidota bacterium]|nr:DNA primase [Bacteroidota bacterium]